jgi:excisionase family DNA binding protein
MITNYHISSKPTVPPLLKIRDVAKLLSISRATVHALIEQGDLAASQVGPSDKKQRLHVRVTRQSLCTFYQKRFGHPLDRALENPFQS